MGSMKQKRRKKALKEWAEFQGQHDLSDEDLKRARQIGLPIERLKSRLIDASFDESLSMSQRILEIHRDWQEKIAARNAAIDAGLIEPKKKSPKKESKHDPKWAKAKQICRLNMDDIRKAKELGISPQALIKNVPGPSQQWKAPVKVWIQELYEKRIGSRRVQSGKSTSTTRDKQPRKVTDKPSSTKHNDDHDSLVRNWEQNAHRNDDENYDFLRSLKYREYDFDPDTLVGELHEQAFQIVDCTRCANCCKTKRPKFDESDVERIASHLNMDQTEFIDTYLVSHPDDPPFVTRQMPCPFLGEDNRCTIYEVLPTVCRNYPYTDKEGLTSRTMGVANNALVCPAVFWIVEQMKQQAGR
ncbi:MAG: YkgJ family cysteine cluster protein [Planctomycetota bacterium]|nr:YkgJ family cysteine cluster protein [Planctomycetota bacterium]